MQKFIHYFTPWKLGLWSVSIFAIVLSAIVFDMQSPVATIASLIGATSIILGAKGNPYGKLLMVIFSIIYGYVSWTTQYYGEMITYLGMTLPMELFAFISWIRNPFEKGAVEVKVNKISGKEIFWTTIAAIIVSFIFYPILAFFNTDNLIMSTVSIGTSFLAVFFSARRSELAPLGYAFNDVVLIVLWIMASFEDINYVGMVICFVIFLINDVNAYISWLRMRRRQEYRQQMQHQATDIL